MQFCAIGLEPDVLGIRAGRILKVEVHSGGSNYFGAKRKKIFFGAPTFSVVPIQFFDGIRGTTIKVKQF